MARSRKIRQSTTTSRRVVGSHTLKAGFYWDTSENIQSSGGLGPGDNGTYNLGWGPNSSGNVVADFLLGRTGNYQQVSSFPTNDLKFHQWSLYAQDSFKANRQLTLNYGLRFDHVGQWYGTPRRFPGLESGASINRMSTVPTGLVTGSPEQHRPAVASEHRGVPLSGMKSPLFYYEPRVGLAYDIFGTGKTVLRAGFAVFHYQVSTQVADAATGPEGVVHLPDRWHANRLRRRQFGRLRLHPTIGSCPERRNRSMVCLPGDNKTPLTMDWNVTVSQALPWRSVFEVSYVGNKSQNEWVDGGNGKIGDQNNVQPGGFFLPDPTGAEYRRGHLRELLSPESAGLHQQHSGQ